MKLFRREKYLSRIRGFYDACDLIKVISGIRRCGKSSLMHTIAEELKEKGVSEENLIFYNLDKYGYKDIHTPQQLEELLFSNQDIKGIKYVFIDEIQNVKDFEPVINALREEEEYSIFITGSNSYLLSGELATKLTGRYIEFELFTLTYDEYKEMKKFYNKEINSDGVLEFDNYIIEGGFPRTITLDSRFEKETYVKNVLQDILKKDIRYRVKIRNLEAFTLVQNYIINNFGATTSISNICNDLNKAGHKITRRTVSTYVQVLVDAKVISECKRFDIKSRQSLKNEKKYYLADTSLYYENNTDHRINYGPTLENIVYKYAKSMGYEVSVGKIGNLEVDFIVRDIENNYAYLQVALTIENSSKTEDREYRPLEKIKDNYPKYVLTRRDLIQKRNGIKHANIIEFISDKKLFD